MNLYYHSVRSVLAFGMALTVFLPTLANFRVVAATQVQSSKTSTSTTNQTTANGEPVEVIHGFIIERLNGRSVCRDASPSEVLKTVPKFGTKTVPAKEIMSTTNLVTPGVNNSETGLTIDFDVLPQLDANPNKATIIAAFDRAAAVWEARIKSPVSIRVNIDFGDNDPSGDPFGTNTLGSTGSRSTLIDYPGARTNLLAGSSGAAETAIYNLLPNSFVPTDTGNGAAVDVNRSAAYALGIPVNNPADLNVATISFNKAVPFDFNPDNGINFNQLDFVATAVHEIGHALGFTSNAGGDVRTPTLWDLFRFRPGMSTAIFTNTDRVMEIGGSQIYFTGQSFVVAGQSTSELALSTGGPNGVKTGGGDGNQSSHWKDDTLNGDKFIGIMDPVLFNGVHEEANDNDFMTIELLGWNLLNTVAPPSAPPPPPQPSNDNLANALTITGCSGSASGVNVGATRESGEPNHSPDNGGGNRSVWFQWRAPSNTSIKFKTAGSRFDTVLAVYNGTTYASLPPAAPKSDDNTGTDKTSTVTLNAVGGTTYSIAVDGYNNGNAGGDFGPLTLTWGETDTCTNTTPPEILLEENGPAADQAAIFDSMLWLRDPFPVINGGNLLITGVDKNTRVVMFVANMPGVPSGSVVVNLVDSNNQSFDVTSEDVHEFTELQFTQVTFRLPANLAIGTCKVKVTAQNLVSNTATFRIRN